METGKGLGREWRMGARDTGMETGKGLGREWRMRAGDRGNGDRERIGKGVENASKGRLVVEKRAEGNTDRMGILAGR